VDAEEADDAIILGWLVRARRAVGAALMVARPPFERAFALRPLEAGFWFEAGLAPGVVLHGAFTRVGGPETGAI
jgi:hypothetical protein